MALLKNLCLLTLLTSASARAQWSGQRQPLSTHVNTAASQAQPVFSDRGDTLFYSESASGPYSVRYSVRQGSGWTAGQPHALLNPPTPGDKWVWSYLCSGQFLVNGHYRRIGRNFYQSRGLAFTYTTDPARPDYLSLPFQGADTMYNSRYATAFLFKPAKLLFLSTGRAGNLDLFVCTAANPQVEDWGRLQWNSPQRLNVNTPFAETAPWLSPDGSTLYFASNRPDGLGGYDIWSSTRTGPGFTEWSVPKNLGAPINSKGSETAFTIDPVTGDAVFVSDQETAGGTDLFIVRPGKKEETGPVVATTTEISDTDLTDSAYKPTNIVFLLDLSNSMKQQRRMALLKTAMKPLVRALRPVDRVSLYRFGDHLARLYESPAQTDNKRLLTIVDSLRSQGEATNGSAAISEGYREAQRKLLPQGNNQVFLVTDGDFPIFPDVERSILSTPNVQLTVVMIDETPEGQRLLDKFRRFPGVQIVTLTDVQRDADALLRNVQRNARKTR